MNSIINVQNISHIHRRTSEKNNMTNKDFQFPQNIKVTRVKQVEKRNLDNGYGLSSKQHDANWSGSVTSRTSEVSFGCDRQIELKNKSYRQNVNCIYLDDECAEYSDTESQQRLKTNKIMKPKFIERSTQTDIKSHLFMKRSVVFITVVLLLSVAAPGLTYFLSGIIKLDIYDLMYDFSKHNHHYHSTNSPQNNEDEGSTTAIVVTENDKTFDYKIHNSENKLNDYHRTCQNIKDVVHQMELKLVAVEKEVALFHQHDLYQNEIDHVLTGYLYGPSADYALEATGGSIIDTPFTTTYTPAAVTVTLFGVPLWKNLVSHARLIIKGTMQPGQCWAFVGSEGRVVIRLSSPIKVSAVTLEHFPAHLLPANNGFSSAPKLFTVKGFTDYEEHSETERRSVELGTFRYKRNDRSRQTFYVQRELAVKMSPVQFVEFHFKTNHGNPDYTCVYRVRVHGEP